jgi:4-hydroxybenzoate polyprenyltransferase/phosphoserine phosphatase
VSAITETDVPLCVDLDGTLLRTDMVWESLVRLLKKNPLYFVPVLFWLLRGRAYLKAQIAERVHMEVNDLPYNQLLVDFLSAEKRSGRSIILATASDEHLAHRIAEHLRLFDEVLASNGKINLRGKNKVKLLAERFGVRGFDYAGNSSVDLPVWEQSRQAIVVGGDQALADRARQKTTVSHVFGPDPRFWSALARALRPHQWVKNLIIFVPLLTAHVLAETSRLLQAGLAFVAFSFCASAVYILNDLFDLDADRHHPTKRLRPFASGELALPVGLALFPVLVIASGLVSWAFPWRFSAVLGVYILLTTSYSLRLREVPLLDVFCLASLYTVRLIAGHEAALVPYSFWLLVFSMFIFLSLALMKRFTELVAARQQNRSDLKGRGYASGDLQLVATLGTSSGYLAVLVLALYVNSRESAAEKLYQDPMILLLLCPLLLYWVSRVWLLAHRGEMHDDPIVFALKDPGSYIVGLLTLLILWLASVH